MVCYNRTVQNSLGDLVQWIYGKDGMGSTYIEKQTIETFGSNDCEFEHNYHVDVMDPVGGFLPSVSLELQVKLDACLGENRRLLREFVFRHVSTNQPHYSVNLHRILQNAIQIFHINDCRKPSDLEPAYIIDAELKKCLVVVHRDNPLSQEAQKNATLNF